MFIAVTQLEGLDFPQMFPGNWVQLQLGKGCSFQKQAPEHMVSALHAGRVSQLHSPLHATTGTEFQLPAPKDPVPRGDFCPSTPCCCSCHRPQVTAVG